MPFGEKPGFGSLLKPTRIDLPPSPTDLVSKDTGLPEMFRRPRRTKYRYSISETNPNYQFGNWAPATAACWNYSNQWLHDINADVYVPPLFLMTYPLPDGVGAVQIETLAPTGQTQAAATKDQFAIFWFFEADLLSAAAAL